MNVSYDVELDGSMGAWLHVEFATDRRGITDYAVVLAIDVGGSAETIRVYDGAHGENEMHRYTSRGGKQAAEAFDHGTLGEGMRTAIDAIKRGYRHMIEAWDRL